MSAAVPDIRRRIGDPTLSSGANNVPSVRFCRPSHRAKEILATRPDATQRIARIVARKADNKNKKPNPHSGASRTKSPTGKTRQRIVIAEHSVDIKAAS